MVTSYFHIWDGTVTGFFTLAACEVSPDPNLTLLSVAVVLMSAGAGGMLIWENAKGVRQLQQGFDRTLDLLGRRGRLRH